jgi:hypothetical protein
MKTVYRTKLTAFALQCNEDKLVRQNHIIVFNPIFFLLNHSYFVDLYLFFIVTLYLGVLIFLTCKCCYVYCYPHQLYTAPLHSIKVSINNLHKIY